MSRAPALPLVALARAAGPVAAGLMWLAGPPAGLAPAGWVVLAVLVWMLIWWVSEAVPSAITALLPLVVLPAAGVAKPGVVAGPYADPIIFLFIGGFILALGVERWGLHRRLALGILVKVGTTPVALLAGFMGVSALLSMWISNTATTLMLAPIALGVAAQMRGVGAGAPLTGGALVLGVAWAANIGGIATPVGSPTNLIAMGWLERQGLTVGFADWVMVALPLAIAMLVPAWWLLARALTGGPPPPAEASAVISLEQARLGAITQPETRMLWLFGAVALAWMLREPLSGLPGLGGLTDMGIALAGALALFLMPASRAGGPRLMDWETARQIPWDIALLFGGGLAMAAMMEANGVTDWLAVLLRGAGAWPALMLIALLVAIVVFATELVSNVATLSAFLPVVGALALAAGLDPLLLAFPAAIAASMAFMMPIATAPNAIAYASGEVPLTWMIRLGILLNLVAIVAITLAGAYVAPRLIG